MTTSYDHESGKDDESSVIYRTEHDPDDGTPLSTSLLMALESVPEFDVKNGETIVFDYIDLEALDNLFRSEGEAENTGHVTFPAGQYDVTVTAAGKITVRE